MYNLQLKKFLPLVGRSLVAAIFLVAGFMKIVNAQAMQQYMVSYGITEMTSVFLALAIVIELVGGLSLLFGFKARWGAFFLALFLFPTTMIFHTNFGEQTQVWMFMKNLAIMGALINIMAYGAGPLSFDEVFEDKRDLPQSASFLKKEGATHPYRPLPTAKQFTGYVDPFDWTRRSRLPAEEGQNQGRSSDFLANFGNVSVDVYEEEDNLIAEINVPGVSPEEIDLEIEERYLKISGSFEETTNGSSAYYGREIRRGNFSRVISLPYAVKSEEAEAHYEKGVLKVAMPRRDAPSRKKVEITVT